MTISFIISEKEINQSLEEKRELKMNDFRREIMDTSYIFDQKKPVRVLL